MNATIDRTEQEAIAETLYVAQEECDHAEWYDSLDLIEQFSADEIDGWFADNPDVSAAKMSLMS